MLRAALISAFVALSLCVMSTSGASCSDASDCGSNECCQLYSKMPFVSKRAIDLNSGFCKDYIQQGEQCITFSDYDGICGCAPGLTCTVDTTRGKRRVSMDRMGSCQ